MPHFASLRSQRGWTAGVLDPKATRFGVVRFHFVLEDQNLLEPTLRGDTLGTYRSSAGTGMEVSDKLTWTSTSTNVQRLVQGWAQESETIKKITQECLGESGIKDLWKFSSSLKTEVEAKYSTSRNAQSSTEESHTETVTREWSAKFSIAPEDTREHCVVAVYRIRPTRVYLSYLDYLTVNYEHQLWGYRRKRTKAPVATNTGKRRPNVEVFGLPLVELQRPERMPSAWVLPPDEVEKLKKITDPTEIRSRAFKAHPRNRHATVWDDVPTLYQLAEVAFPMRRVTRTSSEWTEEELRRIETDESRASETSWFPSKQKTP